jgi:hypothetical protein
MPTIKDGKLAGSDKMAVLPGYSQLQLKELENRETKADQRGRRSDPGHQGPVVGDAGAVESQLCVYINLCHVPSPHQAVVTQNRVPVGRAAGAAGTEGGTGKGAPAFLPETFRPPSHPKAMRTNPE